MSKRIVYACKLGSPVYGVAHQAVVIYDSEYEEYVVRFFANGILDYNKSYYTDDKKDAIDTARKALFDLGRGQFAVETTHGELP